MNAFFSLNDLFMVYIPKSKQQIRTMKSYTQIRNIAHWTVLLSESRAIINDLHVILHGFMLQIIYTTVFRVKWLQQYHASRVV